MKTIKLLAVIAILVLGWNAFVCSGNEETQNEELVYRPDPQDRKWPGEKITINTVKQQYKLYEPVWLAIQFEFPYDDDIRTQKNIEPKYTNRPESFKVKRAIEKKYANRLELDTDSLYTQMVVWVKHQEQKDFVTYKGWFYSRSGTFVLEDNLYEINREKGVVTLYFNMMLFDTAGKDDKMSFFFPKEGEYEVYLSTKDHQTKSNSIKIQVLKPTPQEEKILPLFIDEAQVDVFILGEVVAVTAEESKKKGLEAVAKFERLVREAPDTIYAKYAAGVLGFLNAYNFQFDKTKRVNYLSKALEITEDNPFKEKALYELAHIYAYSDEYQKALPYIEMHAKEYPRGNFSVKVKELKERIERKIKEAPDKDKK